MPDVRYDSLKFDEPPHDVLVHSVYREPAQYGFGLTSCNMSFTYTGHMDAPLKYYASKTNEVVSCLACVAYGR